MLFYVAQYTKHTSSNVITCRRGAAYRWFSTYLAVLYRKYSNANIPKLPIYNQIYRQNKNNLTR